MVLSVFLLLTKYYPVYSTCGPSPLYHAVLGSFCGHFTFTQYQYYPPIYPNTILYIVLAALTPVLVISPSISAIVLVVFILFHNVLDGTCE